MTSAACTMIAPGTESAEQYHRSGAWGSTLINKFLKSPRLAHEIISGRYQPPETAAMRFGTAFHCLLDPGGGFDKRYQLGPDADRRTKEWKTAEATANAAGKILIPADEWTDLHRMADSVWANSYAAALLTGAEHEIGFRMDAPYGAFRTQCRADVFHRGAHIGDLKTTADLDDFARSVASFGYYRQAAFYRWIISQECGKILPFSIIAVEKAEPLFRSRVIDLSPEYLDIGWDDVERALIEIGKRTASGDWSDHADHALLQPPNWLLKEQRTADDASEPDQEVAA